MLTGCCLDVSQRACGTGGTEAEQDVPTFRSDIPSWICSFQRWTYASCSGCPSRCSVLLSSVGCLLCRLRQAESSLSARLAFSTASSMPLQPQLHQLKSNRGHLRGRVWWRLSACLCAGMCAASRSSSCWSSETTVACAAACSGAGAATLGNLLTCDTSHSSSAPRSCVRVSRIWRGLKASAIESRIGANAALVRVRSCVPDRPAYRARRWPVAPASSRGPARPAEYASALPSTTSSEQPSRTAPSCRPPPTKAILPRPLRYFKIPHALHSSKRLAPASDYRRRQRRRPGSQPTRRRSASFARPLARRAPAAR